MAVRRGAAEMTRRQRLLLLAALVMVGVVFSALPPLQAAVVLAVVAALMMAIAGPQWAVVLAFASIPLELFEFQLGPVALSPSQITVILAVGLMLVDMMAKGRFELPGTPLDAWIFLWLGAGFFSAIGAYDPAATIKKAGLAVVFVGFYYLVVARLRKTETITKFMRVFVASSVAVGAYGVWMAVRYLASGTVTDGAIIVGSEGLDVPRAGSTLGQPTVLGAIMVLALPIAVALIIEEKRRWAKLLAAAATVVILVTLGFTFTRGAWLGGVAALGVMLADRRSRSIVLVMGLIVLALSPEIVFERAASSANTGRKEISHRFDYWVGALLVGEQNPVFGAGIDNFRYEYSRLPVPETALRSAGHPHNLALDLFAETGLAGLMSFGGLITGGLVLLFRHRGRDPDEKRRLWRLAVAAALTGTMVHQTTDSLLLEPTWNLVFWTMLALAVSMSLGWCETATCETGAEAVT